MKGDYRVWPCADGRWQYEVAEDDDEYGLKVSAWEWTLAAAEASAIVDGGTRRVTFGGAA